MGFWDVTKRMLQGKPAFEVPAEKNPGKTVDEWGDPLIDPDEVAVTPVGERIHRNQRIDAAGRKMIAEAEIIDIQSRFSGAYVEVWATIRNNSPFEIMLDKIQAFGTKHELDYPLPPQATRQFQIYKGMQFTSNAYTYAELYYLDKGSGDYFCATHIVVYQHESDGTYDVADINLVRPIKDV
jgi:hypothetical protein